MRPPALRNRHELVRILLALVEVEHARERHRTLGVVGIAEMALEILDETSQVCACHALLLLSFVLGATAVGELERDRREQTPLLVEPERDLERGFRLRGRLARVAPSGAREQQGEARVQPAQRLRLLAEERLSTVEPPEVHAGGGGVQAAEAVGEIEQLRRRRERGALRPLQLLDLRVERRKGAVDLGDARGAAAALPRR